MNSQREILFYSKEVNLFKRYDFIIDYLFKVFPLILLKSKEYKFEV